MIGSSHSVTMLLRPDVPGLILSIVSFKAAPLSGKDKSYFFKIIIIGRIGILNNGHFGLRNPQTCLQSSLQHLLPILNKWICQYTFPQQYQIALQYDLPQGRRQKNQVRSLQ